MSPDRNVEIRLFGALGIVTAVGPVSVPAGAPATLLRLVATLGAAHVDEIIEVLWPDAPADAGRARLRNVLSRLRASNGELLVRVGASVALADGVVVDLAVFEAIARRALALPSDDPDAEAMAEQALALCEQVLLPEDVYRDWAAAPRERVRRRRLALLDLIAERTADRGDIAGAQRRWLEAIDLEPYDETRYVTAARALVDAGRWGAAHVLLQRAEVAMGSLGVPLTPQLIRLRQLLSSSAVG